MGEPTEQKNPALSRQAEETRRRDAHAGDLCMATKRAGEQDEGVCRKVQFQAVGAFGMAAHLWRRCQHAPAPQVEGEAEESDIGCVAQARKGAQANKTIAAFHRAEQASMAGGSRRRYDCEPPSEIASASAAHQSVGKPRAVSSRRQNRHQSGTRHYIRMKHPTPRNIPRAPDHQWHRA